ncbi:MAG: hypothetical protein H6623_03625 [Bdellovibrionaceae bacterium]|nr:hypothetical protein [Pseudobdellovibrionaceae bacterium]
MQKILNLVLFVVACFPMTSLATEFCAKYEAYAVPSKTFVGKQNIFPVRGTGNTPGEAMTDAIAECSFRYGVSKSLCFPYGKAKHYHGPAVKIFSSCEDAWGEDPEEEN